MVNGILHEAIKAIRILYNEMPFKGFRIIFDCTIWMRLQFWWILKGYENNDFRWLFILPKISSKFSSRHLSWKKNEFLDSGFFGNTTMSITSKSVIFKTIVFLFFPESWNFGQKFRGTMIRILSEIITNMCW